MKLPRLSFIRIALLVASALGLAFSPLRAEVPSTTGSYENEGSVVETDSNYAGPVSLSGLLGLEFDLAAGLAAHGNIAQVEIEQRDRTFTVRTKDADKKQVWTGTWERNGGYEPTKDGVKILLRHARFGDDFFMYTFTTGKEGAILLLEIQRIQADKLGRPIGKPVGRFLFLRAAAGG